MTPRYRRPGSSESEESTEKNESLASRPKGGEDTKLAIEERMDLFVGAANRRRRRNHLWSYDRILDAPSAQGVDRGFVQADHRPQRACDEVQLVLNDELGRREPLGFGDEIAGARPAAAGSMLRGVVAVRRKESTTRALLRDATEERGHLSVPRHLRELVNGREEQGGALSIDLVID